MIYQKYLSSYKRLNGYFSDHDWSISGDTICHDLVSRLDTITYVSIKHQA